MAVQCVHKLTYSDVPDTYVIHAIGVQSGVAAVADSIGFVSFFDYARGAFAPIGRVSAHRDAITSLSCSFRDSLVYSSSEDGTVAGFDVRAGREIGRISEEASVLSCAVCQTAPLLATAVGNSVRISDLRSPGKHVSMFDSHSDEVSQLRFDPNQPMLLFSAGEDGLICSFDIQQTSEDDALLDVVNTEQSVARMGFFGSEWLYSIGMAETLSLWNMTSGSRLGDFGIGEVQKRLSVEYLLDCSYNESSGHLWLFSGLFSGQVRVANVGIDSMLPVFDLIDGHSARVRCFARDGNCIISGGEDNQLCLWDASGTSEH